MDTARPDAPVTEEIRKCAYDIWRMSQRSVSIVHIAQYLANYARDQRLDEAKKAYGQWRLSYADCGPALKQRIAALSAPAEPAKEDKP